MYVEELEKLIRANHLLGTFKLSSGRDANDYYNLAPIVLNTNSIQMIVRELYIEMLDLQFDSVGCLELCPVPLIGAMLISCPSRREPLKGFIVRKQSKGHGTDDLIEGNLGKRVVLLEDVTSTGASVLRAAKVVEAAGSEVAAIVTIVNRQEGCDGLLAEYDFRSLFTKESLMSMGVSVNG